jgi:iduronate 2-sulfatase
LETKNLAAGQSEVVSRLRVLLAKLPEAKLPVRAGKVSARQKVDRAALFERKDRNRDHQLTREEFLADQPDPAEAPKRFTRFDANQDGILTRDEFIHMGAVPKP